MTLKFNHLSTAQAGHVQMVASGTALIEMALPLDMHQVQLVNQTLPFQQSQCAIHGDPVNFGINLARLAQDLAGIEMLFCSLHNAEDGAALAGEANAALHELGL